MCLFVYFYSQILIVSTGTASLGSRTPLYFLFHQMGEEGLVEAEVLLLHSYLGLAWALGALVFGCLVVQRSGDCRVGRQYLCQVIQVSRQFTLHLQVSLFLCGLSLLGLTAVEVNYWIH